MPSVAESFALPLPTADVVTKEPATSSTYLSGADTIAADPQTVPQTLDQHRLASWEDTREIHVEGDVVDASAVHLINPVDIALSTKYPDSIISLNQHTREKARADKCWLYKHPVSQKYFAVLDYKRPGTIRDHEFRSAEGRRGMTFEEKFDLVAGEEGMSYFDDNARKLSRQAVNYAHKYNTRYIALFDWERLVLLVLEDQRNLMGGNWCCVTIIKNRSKFRPALLGFLEQAYQASQLSNPPLLRQLSQPGPRPSTHGMGLRSSRN
ncbi:hypothetical protein AK830_g4237 [Neonectria ditissima]|uniref:Fungal-type protein kinase domain-containing protein n=1 Tax=Neonectria ditissima TaxID=78410 RepID=A0A0N8H7P1_9HYPO|nr:hypothetical protein AK830_g4237 [Neonectria ditissima]